MKNKLKLCLVLDSLNRRRQSVNEIRNILNNHNVEFILVDATEYPDEYFNANKFRKAIEFFKRIMNGKFTALIHLEDLIASKLKNKDSKILKKVQWFNQRVNLLEEIPELLDYEIKNFSPIKVDKYRYDFPDEILSLITQRCDVVVLEGFNRLLTGKILSKPRLGVVSGHMADITKYRGRPQGFFQWINNEETIGESVQILTDEIDGGYLLVCDHADISQATSWLEVRLKSFELRGDLISRGLDILSDPNFKPEILGTGVLTRTKDADKLKNSLKCISKNIKKRYFKNTKKDI